VHRLHTHPSGRPRLTGSGRRRNSGGGGGGGAQMAPVRMGGSRAGFLVSRSFGSSEPAAGFSTSSLLVVITHHLDRGRLLECPPAWKQKRRSPPFSRSDPAPRFVRGGDERGATLPGDSTVITSAWVGLGSLPNDRIPRRFAPPSSSRRRRAQGRMRKRAREQPA
jgi:hypothetical protein